MVYFDQQQEGFENFHLIFLLQLSSFLGFGPTSGADVTSQVAFAGNQQFVGGQSAVIHFQLFEEHLDKLLHQPEQIQIPNGRIRRELLYIIIKYYQLHVEKLGEIRSLQVLSEVLSE
jgi:DNA repair protein RecO (recombination protein O)